MSVLIVYLIVSLLHIVVSLMPYGWLIVVILKQYPMQLNTPHLYGECT